MEWLLFAMAITSMDPAQLSIYKRFDHRLGEDKVSGCIVVITVSLLFSIHTLYTIHLQNHLRTIALFALTSGLFFRIPFSPVCVSRSEFQMDFHLTILSFKHYYCCDLLLLLIGCK